MKSEKMTPVEALKIFGLKAGKKYSKKGLNQAVARTRLRAQHTVQHGGTDKAQDDAIRTLVQVKEAERVLRGLVRGGTLCVPPGPAASLSGGGKGSRVAATRPAPRRKKQSVRPHALPGATGFTKVLYVFFLIAEKLIHSLISAWRSAVVRELAGAVGKLFFAAWLLLKAPFSLLRRKEYVHAGFTAVIVAAMMWIAVGFITGGVSGFSTGLRQAAAGFNQVMVQWVRGEKQDEKVEIKGSHLEKITVKINGKELSESQIVSSGSHNVRIHSGERVLFSGELHFSHSGQVEIEELQDGGMALKIQWKGGVKWLALSTSRNHL